jgi:hypothetical protein
VHAASPALQLQQLVMMILHTEPSCTPGDWVGDMKHGQGTSCYPSGNSYSGGWAHDKQQGHGTMVYRDSGQTYTGQWVDGLPHGLGEHVWHQPHQQGQQQQQPQGPPCAHRGPGHAVNVMHNRCGAHACTQCMHARRCP